MPVMTPTRHEDLIESRILAKAQIVPCPGLEEIGVLQRLGLLMANPWKNALLPASLLKRFLQGSRSPLIEESFRRPGGWRSMQMIYRNEEPVDWLDDQALRSNPVSMASRNRCRLVVNLLAKLISEFATDLPINLLGVGSGPGVQIQSAIAAAGIAPEQVNAYLIDLDDDAREFGESVAKQLGLSSRVHFRTGDARRIAEVLPDTEVHLAKLVGIVEYLTDEELVEMLTAIGDVMTPNGVLVTHGMVDVFGVSTFLKRVFNLSHRYRTANHMTRLLDISGFRCIDCVVDPTGTYPILTARRAS